ncbi:GntR family transcriptional regulator [Streptomyces sp. NPDC001523]|uniref:GntR family transcriptional regulator n=1 Tax=Streptomyces sp. NPDC001523 TaxID=3154383 RepID=UPI00331B1033
MSSPGADHADVAAARSGCGAAPVAPSRVTRSPWKPDWSEEFGVSRMTVRAALAALERDGILERLPGRGGFVSRVAATRPVGRLVCRFTGGAARLVAGAQRVMASRRSTRSGSRTRRWALSASTPVLPPAIWTTSALAGGGGGCGRRPGEGLGSAQHVSHLGARTSRRGGVRGGRPLRSSLCAGGECELESLGRVRAHCRGEREGWFASGAVPQRMPNEGESPPSSADLSGQAAWQWHLHGAAPFRAQHTLWAGDGSPPLQSAHAWP